MEYVKVNNVGTDMYMFGLVVNISISAEVTL